MTEIYGISEVDLSEGSSCTEYFVRVVRSGQFAGSLVKVERRTAIADGRVYYAERDVGYNYASNLSESQKDLMIKLLVERHSEVLISALRFAGRLDS